MVQNSQLSKDSVELPHPFGQIAFESLDQEMVMIAHQAVGMTQPPKT
jgi:hypothetical protein